MTTPLPQEEHISQIPALILLQKLGYKYLTPSEALQCRGNKESNVLLENILFKWLKENNSITFKNQTVDFTDSNVQKAIDELKHLRLDGLVHTNEKAYDLITLGKSLEQNIAGDNKSFNIQYIDWKNFSNNVFHVVEEFSVERKGSKTTSRPDIVLFVNGIPFCVIECKRPDKDNSVEDAISQLIGYQKDDYIPQLFVYCQLLLSINKNAAKYGTVCTKSKFWAFWKEEGENLEELESIIKEPLSEEKMNKLFSDRFKYVRQFFNKLEAEGRLLTEQDKVLYHLCRPERLLEITQKFIVFDGGEKKVARYQQFFAIQSTIQRIKGIEDNGKRLGGVIWHTQGSGKSLTMVMLAKAIALEPEIKNEKIVIVTDRVDLDDQIWKTFVACQKDPIKASTGKHLLELLEENKASIITTVIDKFESALNQRNYSNPDPNIFVLVDESHRSQYGSANAKMQKVFPQACYIGFTGTPLMKKDKNTATRFGGYIHKYTIDQAVEDGAVVPLLYEGRHVVQEVNQKEIDNWFERVTKNLTDDQKKDLKKKFSTANKLNETDQKIYRIAYDISEHFSNFRNYWANRGFKAQLVAPSKKAAIKYKQFLDEFEMVTSEVLISAPDTREGNEDVDAESKQEVQTFWKKMMQRFQTEEKYQNYIIDSFKYHEEPEIIIVVDKLLTGFDAPKNTVLYITKSLKEHGLLQAIARVNRVCEGKDWGYILDYYGLLGNLDEALTSYSSLQGFDEEDIDGALINIEGEVAKLPQKHSELWDVFKTIKQKQDQEEYEQFLRDEFEREKFYNSLRTFAKCLKTALSSVKFITNTPEHKQQSYLKDLAFFEKLRASVRQRYSEAINFKDYEDRVEELLNRHVKAEELITITEQVSIFDKEKFQEELNKVESKAAKADRIASRTQRVISEKMGEDPVFYTKFSKLIEDAIKAYLEKRITEAEYLSKVLDIMEKVRSKKDDDLPPMLKNKDHAQAYFRKIREIVQEKYQAENLEEICANLALEIDTIIQDNAYVDWHRNKDLQNKILNQLDLKIYDCMRSHKWKPDTDIIDKLLDDLIEIAKRRLTNG